MGDKRAAKRPPTVDQVTLLGDILFRSCTSDVVAYWGEHSRRPWGDGDCEGGMTIDGTIAVTRDEIELLDDLFVQW